MRLILRLVGVVVSLVVLAIAALFVIPTDRLANLAAQQFEGVTGRSVVFSGNVRPMIYPAIGVRTGPVALSNAPWSQAGPMFRADALEIALDLSAALRGEVVVRRIAAQDAVISLERQADGRANWEFGTGESSAAGAQRSGAARTFTIDDATLANATLRLDDRMGGETLTITGLDATLALPEFTGPAKFVARAHINGQQVSIDANIAQVSTALSGAVSGLDLRLEVGGSRIDFAGRAGFAPMAAEGQLSANLGDHGAVFAALGLAAPDMPAGLAGPIEVTSQVTLAPAGSFHLRSARLRLGANTLSGVADLTFDGPRPRLVAQIDAGQLDLRAVSGGGGAAVPAAPGWSRAQIDASALGTLDAEVTVAARGVDLAGIAIGPVRIALNLDRARAVFDLREVALYDGNLTGEFVINARSGLSMGGNLRADGIALLPLLRDFAGFERLAGTGAARLRFLAVGSSVDAMMRSLSGEGRIDLGAGEIIGLDLAGMLRSLDMRYMGEGSRTIYRSIGGGFSIADGVLRNEDLTLDAPRVTAAGRGTVDIGGRMIDYRIIPTALADADGAGGIRVPLLIRGSWDAPRFSIDLEGLAQERLRAERAEIEARARDEARQAEERARERAEQQVIDRLGLDPQDGERLEDAARRRLEQEATDRLRGLLLGR